MFKRKYLFKRKVVVFLRFSLKSNFWESHVAITHINTHTHSCRYHALRSGQALRCPR